MELELVHSNGGEVELLNVLHVHWPEVAHADVLDEPLLSHLLQSLCQHLPRAGSAVSRGLAVEAHALELC